MVLRMCCMEFGATRMSGTGVWAHMFFYCVQICFLTFGRLFVHNTDSLEITNSIFADNGWGIQFTKNDRITVRDSVFSGQTNNLGNPSKCWDSSYFFDCRPADPGTCK